MSFWAIVVSSIRMNNKLLNLIIAFLPAYIMIATRIIWLPDDLSYVEHWNEFNGMSFSEYFLLGLSTGKFEPGFWLIEQIPSYNATTALISTLYVATQIYVIHTFVPKKYYPLVLTLIFFNPQFATSLSARRTTVAMCLFMIAVVLKCKEEQKKRLFPTVLAMSSLLFHNTAVFMLPFIFIPLHFAEKHLRMVFLGFVSLFLLTIMFPGFFHELFVDNVEDTMLEHYAKYAETGGSLSLFGIIRNIFIVLIAVLVLLSYIKNYKNGSYSFMLLLTLVYLSFSILNIGQARIKVYSSLFTFIFIVLSYHHRHCKETQLLLLLFTVFILGNYVLWYQKLGGYGGFYSQYNSFLFELL